LIITIGEAFRASALTGPSARDTMNSRRAALSIYLGTARLKWFGAWLSLVERLVRDQEAGGSNPLAPTT
jgi:hypothetical protein